MTRRSHVTAAAAAIGVACLSATARDCDYALKRIWPNSAGPRTYIAGSTAVQVSPGEAGVFRMTGTTYGAQSGMLAQVNPTPEGELCIANGSGDTTNGGCTIFPPLYAPIQAGDRLLGEVSTYFTSGDRRDTDWYSMAPPSQSDLNNDGMVNVEATLTSEAETVVIILDGIDSCTVSVVAYAYSSDGKPATASAMLAVDTNYAVFVSTANESGSIYTGYPCGPLDRRYLLEVGNVETCPPSCPGDISGDGQVGVFDLLQVINNWGPCPSPPPSPCPADIAPPGGNGSVGVPDLLAVIGGWGACVP